MLVPVLATLATLGLVYASRTSVGDDARQYDIVLVPLERVSAPMSAQMVALSGELRDELAKMGRKGSIAFRVDQANKDTLLGAVMGVLDQDGNGEYANVGDEEYKDVPIPRKNVIGILRRGIPLGTERPQLEQGRFAFGPREW